MIFGSRWQKIDQKMERTGKRIRQLQQRVPRRLPCLRSRPFTMDQKREGAFLSDGARNTGVLRGSHLAFGARSSPRIRMSSIHWRHRQGKQSPEELMSVKPPGHESLPHFSPKPLSLFSNCATARTLGLESGVVHWNLPIAEHG